MTTINQAREACYQRFQDEWDLSPVIVFEGEPQPEGNVEWVRLTVRNMGGGQETQGSVGSRKFRRRAHVLINVFAFIDRGRRDGDTYAQAARAIFEAVSFSGLDFIDGRIHETGPDDKWDTTLVEVLFDYDEVK